MFVNLRKKGTDLHVRLTLVLKHLEPQRWLCWVVEVLLNVVACQILQALLQTHRAFVQHAKFLVAQSHVVLCEKKHELVTGIVLSLNLLKHCLSFLKQNQRFFKALLRNEVY